MTGKQNFIWSIVALLLLIYSSAVFYSQKKQIDALQKQVNYMQNDIGDIGTFQADESMRMDTLVMLQDEIIRTIMIDARNRKNYINGL